MTKQVYNTKGKTLDKIREVLEDRIKYRKVVIQYQIDRSKKILDDWLCLKEKSEKEISYLQEFLAKKEKEEKN